MAEKTFIRKLNKFKKSPKIFFKDAIINKKRKLRQNKLYNKIFTPKIEANSKYTVISAIYNVEKYLDDYFNSLIKQSIGFKDNIKLILVDDGSTDNSANIIKRYMKKYPNNIFYFYKENGGQASARNLGLNYVSTDWVTFIDPDDFVDINYFTEVDKFLVENKNEDISLIGCNLIFYWEDLKIFKDNHPLKFKFINGNQLIPLSNQKKNIQLSASLSFFRSDLLNKNNIRFDHRIKPSFEDANFVYKYQLHNNKNSFLGFVSGAKYYYRKRESLNSTLDTSWYKTEYYNELLKYGILDLFAEYKEKNGAVPYTLQFGALYHLSWAINKILQDPSSIDFLTREQKQIFFLHLTEIFKSIDIETILEFNLANFWFYQKIGTINLFKNSTLGNFTNIVYLDRFDLAKNMLRIRYFSRYESDSLISINNSITPPLYCSKIERKFLDKTFIYEKFAWIKLNSKDKLSFIYEDKKARMTLAGKHYKELTSEQIIQAFQPEEVSNKYKDSWILLDRDFVSDDNAEHLYRYIKNYTSQTNIYFAIRKGTNDWKRLSRENFNLLDFGSAEFEQAYKASSKIISSHIDGTVTNYLGANGLKGKKYIFLQHGITKDNLSNWLNNKQIDTFITSTKDEHNSIAKNENYNFTKKEVKLTGFPRHDRLLNLAKNSKAKKSILIMPTWRKNLMGPVKPNSSERDLNPEFIQSEYAKAWRSLLCSDKLKQLAIQYGYEIVFSPHANIIPYLSKFKLPKYIKIATNKKNSIQKLFANSSFMITDYSSVAFEMAYIGRSVLYYQFDEQEFFNGEHVYTKGYYDYRQDGFGAVSTELDDLLIQIERILENDGKPLPQYQQIIDKTFYARDENNCKRVYEAILDLDRKFDPDLDLDDDCVAEYYQQLIKQHKFDLLHKTKLNL